MTLPANAQARAFAAALYTYLGSGPESKNARLHPNPVRVMPGGLEKIPLEGFGLLSKSFKPDRYEHGDSQDYLRPISGEKLVYTIV